ncbi:peptidoglycan DD-metalloendopeptidase family protein [bacterium]|jgi:murein DD-endopeptidase MepM/ murein hydrolase activator NlpD|nr:peptidoglycan DD-metalloendopeptidase family protein [bacterium]MBT6832287.1 peptidoglycan DD-metalloendopeptidase family protein [bacterium]MBT6996224.1 peptidoglycan DD-metalloendopeptidase family protein [bacterium]MBT7772471.1 peptidoglycan DD-metalloendopeptidase family protein [bacterium]
MKKPLELILAFVVAVAAGAAVANKLKKNLGHSEIVAHNGKSVEPVRFVSRRINYKNKHGIWQTFFAEKSGVIVGLFTLLFFSIIFQSSLEKYSRYFKTSLMELEHPVEFIGTAMPIKKVPNWVALSDSERLLTYDELPENKFISLPAYNLAQMRAGRVWRKDNGRARNVYLTYPVPNLGNYELDATEDSGSHAGIDIKTPVGTPVYAIASGVVTKSENQPTGYGQHLVIAHVGVPDPDDLSKKTTLYSAYAHLSSRTVNIGDVVEKNQIIGKTGMSGMATAPHLHFQIDKKNAPFHPYWPFTWKDLNLLSINSYFDAVKQGVGQSKAMAYTIHPVDFVEEFAYYENPNQLVATAGTSDQPIEPEPLKSSAPEIEPKIETIDNTEKIFEKIEIEIKTQEPEIVAKTNTTTRVIRTPRYKKDSQNLRQVTPIQRSTTNQTASTYGKKSDPVIVETDAIFVPGVTEKVTIKISDEILVASAGIEISSTLRNLAEISPQYLTANDFQNGEAQISVITDSNVNFRIVASGDFGETKSKTLRARLYSDIEDDFEKYNAIEFLKNRGIMNGYKDGSFKPNGTLNRAETVKLLIEANELRLLPAEMGFSDVPENAWFTPYVKTALARNLIRGYANGTFLPGKTISRAEFLKLAIEAGEFPLDEVLTAPYSDTPLGEWFTPYFDFAKRKNIFETGSDTIASPSRSITRAEAADVIYNLLLLQR